MTGLYQPSDDGGGLAPKPTRKLPDINRCRVRRSGIADLVCCCSEVDASNCEYAEKRAFNTFCFHPQWREILARSEARR